MGATCGQIDAECRMCRRLMTGRCAGVARCTLCQQFKPDEIDPFADGGPETNEIPESGSFPPGGPDAKTGRRASSPPAAFPAGTDFRPAQRPQAIYGEAREVLAGMHRRFKRLNHDTVILTANT